MIDVKHVSDAEGHTPAKPPPKAQKDHRMTVFVTREMREAVRQLAYQQDTNHSQIIREAIAMYLARQQADRELTP